MTSTDFWYRLQRYARYRLQRYRHKSDVKDARWIAECLQKDLIRGSFVPGDVLQQMRQPGRQCHRLTKSRVRLEQQMDNQLQRCNIRLSNYVSNQGNNVSLRKVIGAIIRGERDPGKLVRLVHGRTRNKHGPQVITDSLDGVLNQADIEMLKQCIPPLNWQLLKTNPLYDWSFMLDGSSKTSSLKELMSFF